MHCLISHIGGNMGSEGRRPKLPAEVHIGDHEGSENERYDGIAS